MKAKKRKLKQQKKLSNEKLILKQEKLQSVDKNNEQKRKNIIKKINRMEKKKKELDLKKEEEYKEKKQERKYRIESTKKNKTKLERSDLNKRLDILEYESSLFNHISKKETNNLKKRAQSQYRTIQNQLENQEKMKKFKRVISALQDDSINNKNDTEKRKMYREKVRKEMELKRKEEEKRLAELGLI